MISPDAYSFKGDDELTYSSLHHEPPPSPPNDDPVPTEHEKDSTDTQDEVAEPSLNNDSIQVIRNAVMNLDPNLACFVLSATGPDSNSLFSDLLTYEPPNPAYDDPYFDEIEYGRIVPVSKLSTCRPPLVGQKRKHTGDDGESQACDNYELARPGPSMSQMNGLFELY